MEKSTAIEDEDGTSDGEKGRQCDKNSTTSIENTDNTEIAAQLQRDEIDLNKYVIMLQQKDQQEQLIEREKKLLQDELDHLKSELKQATTQKEYFVLQFATKEKELLDGRKERDHLQKQLDEARKEVKNITVKYYAINEEKSRLISIIEEKCNEVKKCQKDNEKLKNDVNNLEMKLKWNVIKLNQETESRQAIEKQLKSAVEPSTFEQQKIEHEASLILLKHENEEKERIIEKLKNDHQELSEKLKKLELNFNHELQMKSCVISELKQLKEEHNSAQNTLSQELLNSARLKNELEANKISIAQITLAEEKIIALNEKLEECETERTILLSEHNELNAVIERMSGAISKLHNEIALKNSKLTAIDAEISLLKKDKSEFDEKLKIVEDKLNEETQKRNEEKFLLTKHLSEKTKLHEATKSKLDDILGELDATKKKHLQVVKELHREINKYKKHSTDQPDSASSEDGKDERYPPCSAKQIDNEVQNRNGNTENGGIEQGPSKEHLVERILRLQQAAARQTEKIDFLENHTMSLVAELQKKSKILQYYMLRDHSGALTSSKSDQNKTELAKYGGIMSAIYTGIRGNNQSMTLDLSLEINKKLQAVLEDTILKNITLKENLDVMGLEIDRLIRQLPREPTKGSTDPV